MMRNPAKCGTDGLFAKSSPFIIPIFLPQWGCPFQCVYCRQETITGLQRGSLDFKALSALVEAGLTPRKKKPGQQTEIAFYGGTFTSIETTAQEALLEWGSLYVRQGRVDGLRLSTRPDALSPEIVNRLWGKGVKTIELGVQSLNDQVLSEARRGHTAQDTFQAFGLLKEWPFKIGAQIMLGLPGDDRRAFRETVERLLILKPDLVRIYPTLVLRGTTLARWYEEGRYKPVSLEEAVELCCWAVDLLERAGIPVIRLGLQNHNDLKLGQELLAGPFHPAFGDLVRREIFLKNLKHFLKNNVPLSSVIGLTVSDRDESYLTGENRRGWRQLMVELGITIRLEKDGGLFPGSWICSPTG